MNKTSDYEDGARQLGQFLRGLATGLDALTETISEPEGGDVKLSKKERKAKAKAEASVEADHGMILPEDQYNAVQSGEMTFYVGEDYDHIYKTGEVVEISNDDEEDELPLKRRIGFLMRSEDIHSSVRNYVIFSLLAL